MNDNRNMPGNHEFRIALSEIMHDRSFPATASPVRVRQWLVIHDEDDETALANWADAAFNGDAEFATGRHVAATEYGLSIWERHVEFSTVTIVRGETDARIGITTSPWLEGLPGRVFRSVEILLGKRSDFDWDDEAGFDPDRLVSSFVFDGAARIWSDFTIKENGAGKIMVEDIGLKNDEAARLVQTLIEIGNYRKLALVGFPTARELMPWITRTETEHRAITELHNSGEAEGADVLRRLLLLSSDIECRSSKARFRLGATNSYHLLTTDRLRSLRETRIAGFSTAGEFIERRLLPAMRTCEIAQRRLDGLSERINRTASLLSLEQTIALNRRNQAVLSSLNRRASLQLRLQTLVEGFSIFAISYYIINLIDKILKPAMHLFDMDRYFEGTVGIAAVPTLFATWQILEFSKRRTRSARNLIPKLVQ